MVPLVDGLDNGVARTPPMGWRNWNFFGGAITQDIMEQQFRAMAVSA
jgi:alpha-galactosidase